MHASRYHPLCRHWDLLLLLAAHQGCFNVDDVPFESDASTGASTSITSDGASGGTTTDVYPNGTSIGPEGPSSGTGMSIGAEGNTETHASSSVTGEQVEETNSGSSGRRGFSEDGGSGSMGQTTGDENLADIPLIEQFTASEMSIPAGGGFVVLSWSVSGADEITISPSIGAVTGTSLEIEVLETTTFTLTARNTAGMSSQTQLVAIENEGVLDTAWRAQLGTVENDRSYSVALDSFGNVVIAGSTSGTLATQNAGLEDVFIAKYTPRGTPAWSRQTGTIHGEAPLRVAVGPDDRIYTLNQMSGFVAGADVPENDRVQIWSTGGTLESEWLLAEESFNANDLAVDRNGDVFVAGYQTSTSNGVVLALDENGTETTFAQLDDVIPAKITVSPDGSIYGAGYGPVVFRISGDGETSWSRPIGSGLDSVTGVAVSEQHQILYVAGYTSTGAFGEPLGATDAYVVKLSVDGDVLNGWQFGSGADDFAAEVTVDTAGSAYIVGGENSSLSRGYFSGGSAFAAKFSHPDNELTWSVPSFLELTYSMRGGEMGIVVGRNGYVYLTGPVGGDFAAPNTGLYDAFIARVR